MPDLGYGVEVRLSGKRLEIGDVVARTGLSPRTIRRFTVHRLVNGRHSYSQRDVDKLLLLKHAEPFEWSLRELRELVVLLDAAGASTGFPTQHEQILERLGMFQDVVDERCDQLTETLNQAEEFARLLRAEITSAREESEA